jgi:hypothetical protein
MACAAMDRKGCKHSDDDAEIGTTIRMPGKDVGCRYMRSSSSHVVIPNRGSEANLATGEHWTRLEIYERTEYSTEAVDRGF